MRELADEQDYVNVLYARLDTLREEAAAALVVIADPAAILAADPHGPNDLYVALTRATQRLGVVHPGPVPRELSEGLAPRRYRSSAP